MSWTGISDGTNHEATMLHSDWLVCSGEQIAKEPATNIQRQRFLGPSDAECLETSSTPHGGGGSFKDRKSIGQVGCCESWMPERTH